MTASTPRKLKYLTIKEKFDIVQRKENNQTVKTIVEAYKCSKTQVYDVIKNKDKIKHDYHTVKNVNRKKLRVRIPNKKLNICVYEWYTAAKSQNIPLTGPMLQAKAKEVAKLFNVDQFSASNGWLESFKRRNGINFSGGDIKPMDQEDVKSWCKKFTHVIKDYCVNDMESEEQVLRGSLEQSSNMNTENENLYGIVNKIEHVSPEQPLSSQAIVKEKRRTNRKKINVCVMDINENPPSTDNLQASALRLNNNEKISETINAYKLETDKPQQLLLEETNENIYNNFNSSDQEIPQNIEVRHEILYNNINSSENNQQIITHNMENNIDEFVAFGQSIAMQLKKLPLHIALELQSKFQNMITKKRLLALKVQANKDNVPQLEMCVS